MKTHFGLRSVLVVMPLLNCFAATVQYNTALEALAIPGLGIPSIYQVRSANDGNLRVNFGSIASITPSGTLNWIWSPPVANVSVNELALEVGPEGSTYFLITALPSADGTLTPPFGGGQNIAKLDESGNLVAVMNIGDSYAPSAMAVDSDGDVYLSGLLETGGPESPFTAKFDLTSGRILYLNSSVGVISTVSPDGGLAPGALAVDGSGQVVLVSANGSGQPPATQGALQTSGSQLIAGLDPNGGIRFVTYLGGTGTDAPRGVAVDSSGNIYVAGTTLSFDYPVTSNALQTAFPSLPIDVGNLAPPSGICLPNFFLGGLDCSFPGSPSPARARASGYLSILNSSGSSLLYSTYFGGSGSTLLSAIALDENRGEILLAGVSNSNDLPGIASGYAKCFPAVFGAGLVLDGYDLLSTVPVGFDFTSSPPFAEIAPGFSEIAGGTVALVAVSSPDIAIVDRSSSSPLACTANSADQQPTRSVAPGQLLTLFGNGFSAGAWAAQTMHGSYPTVSPDGLSVTVNGVPAPLLYTSPDQINLQIPFETSASGPAVLALRTAFGYAVTQSLEVVGWNARVFETPLAMGECLSSWAGETYTFAINADGTRNSCTNPAPAGSVVTIFVDGIGPGDGSQVTGGIISPGSITVYSSSIAAPDTNGWSVVSTTPLSGSITGIYAVKIQVGNSGYDVDGTLQIGPALTGNLLDIRVAPDVSQAN